MLRLNRHSSHLAREAGATALTDVSGYGIAGHALEIAERSGVQVLLKGESLPLLPGALDYARAGVDFGGLQRNREQLADRVTLPEGLPEAMARLLFDPQTSGGLLIAVPGENVLPLVAALTGEGYAAAVVGEVWEGEGVVVEA
jgi:selenide,water dikinase